MGKWTQLVLAASVAAAVVGCNKEPDTEYIYVDKTVTAEEQKEKVAQESGISTVELTDAQLQEVLNSKIKLAIERMADSLEAQLNAKLAEKSRKLNERYTAFDYWEFGGNYSNGACFISREFGDFKKGKDFQYPDLSSEKLSKQVSALMEKNTLLINTRPVDEREVTFRFYVNCDTSDKKSNYGKLYITGAFLYSKYEATSLSQISTDDLNKTVGELVKDQKPNRQIQTIRFLGLTEDNVTLEEDDKIKGIDKSFLIGNVNLSAESLFPKESDVVLSFSEKK